MTSINRLFNSVFNVIQIGNTGGYVLFIAIDEVSGEYVM